MGSFFESRMVSSGKLPDPAAGIGRALVGFAGWLTQAITLHLNRNLSAQCFVIIYKTRRSMKTKITIFQIALFSAVFFWSCNASVNRSFYVRDGEQSGGLISVNGSIHLGLNCRVVGSCHAVNGNIEVGDGSRVRDLDTVNGRIHIGSNVDMDGHAGTVNGAIDCGIGSKIHGRLTTVNGSIELRNTQVDEEVSTINGDILLSEKSVARGDIVIKDRRGSSRDHQRLNIRISGGSQVEGSIIVQDENAEVRVYISKDSTVKGEVRNAQVIRE